MCNCNKNNIEFTTECHVCNQTPQCQPSEQFDCPVKDLSTDCVQYTGDDLPCSGIVSGQSETSMWQQMDTFICNLRDELIRMFTLKNIGVGAKIYKGIDSLGRKELRTITKTGNIITVTENPNEVSIGIDEEALNESVTIDNIGTGAEVYKGYNTITNQHEFRTVVQENQGTGESFLRDIQQDTDELKVRIKTLVSNNLTITATDEEVRIETPMTASIPALYVNNLYEPTYQEWLTENKKQNSGTAVVGFQFRGKGTLAQPFTDTIVYTLNAPLTPAVVTPNTAIQNALDAYVGTGLGGDGINPASRLNPKLKGQKIIIQDNTSNYTFTGNFGYSNLNLDINANILTTTSGYLVDMDNSLHFNTLSDSIVINIGEGYVLEITGDGLNNSGTNIPTFLESQRRQVNLTGLGKIISVVNDITKYLINSDIVSTGNNNDGSLTFRIECDIYTKYQGILKIGGVSRVWNFGVMQSSDPNTTVDINLKPYLLLGGDFRNFQGSRLEFSGIRTDAFVFSPTGGFTPTMVGQSVTITSLGLITNLFTKTNNNLANLIFTNSDSSTSLSITNIFESTNLWGVYFNKNTFEKGIINDTKVDLTVGNTVSVSNSIGSNLVEHLISYTSRETARLAGLPTNSVFLIKKYISADNLIAGVEYKITTEGVPSLGTEGTYITATGSETGTGVGMYTERCILA